MDTPISGVFPVLPTRNVVLFPSVAAPLRVGRPGSVAAVDAARAGEGWLLVVAEKSGPKSSEPELHRVGTLAKIEHLKGDSKTGYQLVARGLTRMKIKEFKQNSPYVTAEADAWADVPENDKGTEAALLEGLKKLALDVLEVIPTDTSELEELVMGITDLGFLSHLCIANLDIEVGRKQELLEMVSVKDRVLALLSILQTRKEALTVQGEIQERLARKLGKGQREAILRAQLNAIREELGEGQSDEKGSSGYREKIDKAGMPEDARKIALEELKRLDAIGENGAESHVIRNYLDLLCAMPWSKSSTDRLDLDMAREVLEKDHYGLDQVKRRIIQHLGVMKLKQGGKGSILLFVGPPGVGKTSLGQSIARALGREFARVSLGGARDDAEIRGHRRTYVGAMPGRIVQTLKRVGVNNPVFILDEVDKLGRGFQGDPASALLEVLDPEQNNAFVDHYLDVPFDLSKIFFIATANTTETIPGPLLDRMEVVELSGYTTAEKFHIAKNHIIPKVLEEHGLTAEKLVISDEALLRTITHYTREAGVRELQRAIATISRASVERVLKADAAKPGALPVRVETKDLDDVLGPERHQHEIAERLAPPGVVTGLAWTPQGGEILFVEAGLMPGSGKLTLTGQLGEVMKESAQIALSLVRSRLPTIVPGFEFENKDLHVHVPSGAIPKDGPSAGVAMVTTLASLFTGVSVNPKLAMTGEITLRGAVMAVGGIKEKVIAAHRAGIEKVILPKQNEKDLRDVPEEVKTRLKFEFVENVADVLRLALGIELPQALLPPPDKAKSAMPPPTAA